MNTINSILQFHRLLSLPDPLHPLISIVNLEDVRLKNDPTLEKFMTTFYSVSLKRDVQAKMKYGQNYYDFDKGILSFTAPKKIQILDLKDFDLPNNGAGTGYVLFFHPDFLGKHSIAAAIKNYGFFSYEMNEALHLSEKEEKDIIDIFLKIKNEYQFIDQHTQDIIISQIDLLLNYCNRFYQRQFITRKPVNNDVLTKMENILDEYFEQEQPLKNGLPTVEFLSYKLHVSPHYLSDMLRSLTGQNAQQHIHEKLIDKAKEYLSSSNLSVAEIAYQLGFEYPQSFNKLFKKKTEMSPLEFRQSFN
jgi:AraC family transcriptional activator of pobA